MNGPSLTPVAHDRRFWILLGVAAATYLIGAKLIPNADALSTVSYLGYWFELAGFIFLISSLWFTFREEIKAINRKSFDWLALGAVVLCGIVLLVHESYGFKIVMDEIMLLGTSMSMHLNRIVLVPMRGNDIQGAFTIMTGIVDKRPLFFPFLLSIVHDVAGYRPENAFILNSILTFVFLGLVYAAGRMLAGRVAGILGVLLFGGLPLLAQNATGGGFELLNIIMILATLLLGARFVDKRDDSSLCAFVASALMMTQVRYESAIFVVPVAAIVLWVWWLEGKSILPWRVAFAPALLFIYPIHHRIFEMNASSWQLQSMPGYDKPFSLSYIPENLVHALGFFFGKPSDQPDSIFLSSLGFIALAFSLLLLMRRIKILDKQTPIVAVTTLFTFGFAAHFLLMMCYFWGQFDDPVIRRLSLPMHVWLVLSIFIVMPEFAKKGVAKVFIILAVLALIIQGVPSMAAHAYNQEYLAGEEIAWRRQFIAEHPQKDYLMIDNDSTLWITHQVSGTTVEEVKHRKDSLIYHQKNRTFSGIYVFQRYMIDPQSGKETIRPGDELGPDYVLETVKEQRLQLLTLSRISRVVEITSGPGKTVVKPDQGDKKITMTPAELAKAREEYMENFVRQLP